MPTSPDSAKYPLGHPAPRQYALVVSCVDCRLLDDLVRFLEHDNLTNRYYHFTFAGCAIGLSAAGERRRELARAPFEFGNWKREFYDHLRLVLTLTKGDLSDVYLVEHADCGAYRTFLGVDYYADPHNPDLAAERSEHREHALALGKEIVEWYDSADARALAADLKNRFGVAALRPPLVRGFLMDLRGAVEPLFDPPPASV